MYISIKVDLLEWRHHGHQTTQLLIHSAYLRVFATVPSHQN